MRISADKKQQPCTEIRKYYAQHCAVFVGACIWTNGKTPPGEQGTIVQDSKCRPPPAVRNGTRDCYWAMVTDPPTHSLSCGTNRVPQSCISKQKKHKKPVFKNYFCPKLRSTDVCFAVRPPPRSATLYGTLERDRAGDGQ